MRRVSTKTTKVLAYLENNPRAKPADVAKKFKMAVQYVYKLRGYTRLDKALEMSKPSAVFLTKSSPKKEKLIMTHDNVNHPPHYKAGGIETIDFIEAKSLNYNLGNVVKYITRADYKGNKIEDLKKAQWYLNREVSNLTK
jgi:SpoU rRNA methylase family enzyme